MLTGIIASLDLMKRYIAAGRIDEVERFADAAVNSAQRAFERRPGKVRLHA